jgi:type IV secretory pathway TraG/TraD family ATPase VirD4
MFVTKIFQASMSRQNVSKEDRIPFFLYVDEFQNFATETFKEILSEARKYGL